MKPRSWIADGLREVCRALRAQEPGMAEQLAGFVARETGLSRDEVMVRAWARLGGQPRPRRAA
jgi:hypothetical protein